jgi:hypothetical protein
MTSQYQKNFTERGYLMKYEKPHPYSVLKSQVLQFKIEMAGIRPAIWRRILVPSDYNFWDLHVAIQDAMGWKDYHLHHFEIMGKGKRNEVHIGIPDFDGFPDLQEVYPGWEIWVLAYFNDLGIEAGYLYDYGDDWWHRVKLEGYIHREMNTKYPLCTGGERACPPEDCGGVSGYAEVIKILSDPRHPDHKDMRRWAGKDWDPEKFDPGSIRFDNPYKRWKYAFLEK